MSRWPSENHFASWLGLCPSNELSGGRILKKRTRKVVNRAATAFRMAASALRTSQSYLGPKFRCLRSRLGPPNAITAMARAWPSSSTACSSSAKTTRIAEPGSMSNGSDTSSFNIYTKRLLNSASKSLHYRRHHREFLESAARHRLKQAAGNRLTSWRVEGEMTLRESRLSQGPEGRPPNISQPGRAGISIQRIERRRRGTHLFIATEAYPESGVTSALREVQSVH
jgi:hypothetical protein